MTNPLLDTTTLPRFADIAPADVLPALTELIAAHRQRLDDILANTPEPDFDSVVAPLEEAVLVLQDSEARAPEILRGPLLYVPSCSCVKRFHRSSAAADWKFDLRQSLDASHVLRSYVNDFARANGDAAIAQLVLYPWCLVQALLPRGAAKRLLNWYERSRSRLPPVAL